VQETLLAVTSQGVPLALRKGMVLFGPVAEAGEFATMMQDSECYQCHIDELRRYTYEVRSGSSDADTAHDRVA
jgi:hypothetical protein